MSKPEDIPQDVWEAAAECFASGDWSLWLVDEERRAAHVSIAHAIQTERDRQAAVRDRMAEDWCDFCEAIGVDVDTHEAVAEAVMANFSTSADLTSAPIEGGETP